MIFHVNLCCSPLAQFHYRSPEEGQVARAKVLTEDLLQVVRSEHAKMQTILHQQQMELHQAQAQYAAYSAMAVGSFFFFHLRCCPACGRALFLILTACHILIYFMGLVI